MEFWRAGQEVDPKYLRVEVSGFGAVWEPLPKCRENRPRIGLRFRVGRT